MSLNDIISQIENDSRNYEYTKRNIPPILQVNSKAKVLIIGQAPGKKVEESLIPFKGYRTKSVCKNRHIH